MTYFNCVFYQTKHCETVYSLSISWYHTFVGLIRQTQMFSLLWRYILAHSITNAHKGYQFVGEKTENESDPCIAPVLDLAGKERSNEFRWDVVMFAYSRSERKICKIHVCSGGGKRVRQDRAYTIHESKMTVHRLGMCVLHAFVMSCSL